MTAPESVTQRLAEWASQLTYDQIPAEVRREARRCLLDYLGVTLGAADEDAPRIARQTAELLGGNAQATILGTTQKTSLVQAALVNGIASHVLDFDDTHIITVLHPTGPAMSGALPVAEWQHASGRDLITAFIAGFEVEARIALSICPEHYDRGWHVTGSVGMFGAAAAAGRLMGLDAHQMNMALGIAASQPTGLREQFGTMTKSLHSGKTASNGVQSAIMASLGYTASEKALEALRGFCNVVSDKQDYAPIVEKLGESWEVFGNGIKPYSCGVVIHPSVDAVREMRNKHRLTADKVQSIHARVHPLVLELTSKRNLKVGLEGKFSVFYAMAVALVEGTARQRQFSDDLVVRPDLVELYGKIDATADDAIRQEESEVTATLTDGSQLVVHVPWATGTPQNPISDEDLEAKFRDLVGPYISESAADQTISIVKALDDLNDVGTIAQLVSRS
ncbi:MAG TPA: MmgE/PrpD family protein [Chloroflexota bacterium]|jgi:2-methylcitrate dehydratase PrpD|nr:MmgE/PrpD family protein [Chloroflexota bacterium]